MKHSIKRELLIFGMALSFVSCAGFQSKPPRVVLPEAAEIQKVEVKTCLKISAGEGEVCVPQESEWRFVTIRPLLLNYESLKNLIEKMKLAPCWQKKPQKVTNETEPAK